MPLKVPMGEARLVVEIGEHRFVVHRMTGSRASSAATLLLLLPHLEKDMREQLQRVHAREQRDARAKH